MKTLTSDLRFAARMLWKTPGFALVAIVSLALGVGANTAIFSLIDGVMLRMLPVSHPEQLMFVNTNAVQMGSVRISRVMTVGILEQMQERAKTVAGLCSSQQAVKLSVDVDGQAELASGQFVSGNYFSMLGVQALIGRPFAPRDDTPDGRLAVIGFAYWQKRFGGDPGVIGKPITVNGVPFTIVAVTPREFYGTTLDQPSALTLPLATMAQATDGKMSGTAPKPTDSAGNVFVRVKPGTEKRAATELTGIFRQEAIAEASDPQERQTIEKSWIELAPASQGFSRVRSQFSDPLKVLMGVVALVMLIACANIANLLLAKASAREREIAIRLSLGSTRARLVRLLLTESLLLAFLGGLLGLLLAVWARDGIVYLASVKTDMAIPSSWNLRVILFTAGVCLLNALLFGVAPALRATGVDFAEALKSGRSGRLAGRLPLARVLIAAQVALSLALLTGAALFLTTFRNLERVDVGFDRDHELLVTVDPGLAGYKGAQNREIYRQILERAGAVPGVRSVSLTQSRIMSGNIWMNGIYVPGYTLRKGEDERSLWVISNHVGANFMAISGMHLVSGRDFSERDNETAPKVAVINETMAQHFFEGHDPIGQKLAWDRKEAPMTVVGLLRDIKNFGIEEGKQDVIFTPLAQGEPAASATVLLRTTVDPMRVAADVRSAIRAVDPKVPQYDVTTMDRTVENSLSQQRLLAILASCFGVLALGLAAIGLYGILSYGVTQRTGEIGVRMALGAQRANIVKLILGETARLVAIGILIGIGAAIAGARLVKSMLYGVSPADAWSIGIAAAILAGAALLAGFLPARRASRVDPMVALRDE
jgi:predicted permease